MTSSFAVLVLRFDSVMFLKKYQFLFWRLLQNKLPTRDMFLSRGVMVANNDVNCVLCSRECESVNHLFCDFSYHVWMAINLWIGVVGPMQNNGIGHFLQFAGALKGKRFRRGRHVIWMDVVWVLWMTHNNIIFKEGVVDLIDVIANIKVLSWNWFVNRKGRNI